MPGDGFMTGLCLSDDERRYGWVCGDDALS